MEINKEQLEKLTKLVGEKELKKIIPNAFKHQFNQNKIYMFKGCNTFYKLHRIDGKYAWISLVDSACYANGTNTAQEMLDYVTEPDELLVFNNYKEFVEFLYAKL